MKRFIAFMLILTLLLTTASVSLAEHTRVNHRFGNSYNETPLNRIGYANGSTHLNIRNGPGYDFSIIGKFNNGDSISIVASIRRNGDSWYKVKHNGGFGYVRAPLVSFNNNGGNTTPPSNSWTESPLQRTGYANGSTHLNIRNGPGYDFSIIGKFNNGDSISIVASIRRNGDGWYKIEHNNGFGYVRAPLVSFNNNGGSVTPPGNSWTESPMQRTGYANGTNHLNIRNGPGYDFSIIGKFNNGDTINIVASIRRNGDGWYKITYGDDFAYVRAPLVILAK